LKSIYSPAFSLFNRVGTTARYALTAAGLLAAHAGALALFLLGSDSGGSTLWSTLFYIGCGLFAIGLYLHAAVAYSWGPALVVMARAFDRIGNGDLALTILPGWGSRNEGQRVWSAVNKTSREFPAIVRQVRRSAEMIENGSREIAAGYADLAKRTETQAQTVVETAASMEELSATVAQNAENCRAADAAVAQVGAGAEEAAHAMQQVTQTMTRIETGTRKTAEFVGVIEGIAFQTNILALNANVEAARAGEQGRGFAVVAAEVRALAQRSAEATQHIKALIGASSNKVKEGTALAAKAEDTVHRAAAGIRKAVEMIGSVAGASNEQNAGVKEVGKALTQLEQVTQRNSAFVQEGTAASTAFADESRRLVESASVFKLEDENTPDRAITTGSMETMARNYQLGPIMRWLVLGPMALNISFSYRTDTLVFGIPIVGGPLLALIAAFMQTPSNIAAASSSSALFALLAATVIALLVGTYFHVGLNVYQDLASARMERMCNQLATGDLAWKIRVDNSRREGHMVMRALANINKNFSDIVRQVRASAESIGNRVRELTQSHSELSQRTERQAVTLEETAASMEELTATVKQNAEHCRAAVAAIEDVGARTQEAVEIMRAMNQTMAGIEESATRMAAFLAGIENLSFQTNLLALNAAVEAARAGVEGRGFAVVASEVRALAQRSAEATTEIKTLIAESTAQVSEGAALVAQAEQTVANAATGIQQVVALIGETAQASAEQAAGTQKVSHALSRLDGVTQQNAALVEEGMATATSFEQEAQRLSQLVGVFKLLETKGDERSARVDLPAADASSRNTADPSKPLRLASGT
jgi:methyl-accepting chemotaxis protein